MLLHRFDEELGDLRRAQSCQIRDKIVLWALEKGLAVMSIV